MAERAQAPVADRPTADSPRPSSRGATGAGPSPSVLARLGAAAGNQAVARRLAGGGGLGEAPNSALTSPTARFGQLPLSRPGDARERAAEGAARAALGPRNDPRGAEPSRPSPSVPPATGIGTRPPGDAGSPLPAPVRQDMERRFDHDFSAVRVHTGVAAASGARRLGARAFTDGSHVTFDRGGFAPGSAGGRRLLAHELAHVVQNQAGASPAVARDPGDPPSVEEQIGQAVRSAFYGALGTSLEEGLLAGQGGDSLAQISPVLSLDASAFTTPLGAALDALAQGAGLGAAATALDGVTTNLGGLDLDLVSAGDLLMVFLGAPPALQGYSPTSYGVERYVEVMASDVTEYLVSTHDHATLGTELDFPLSVVAEGFTGLVATWQSPQNLMRLEMEGTVAALIQARQAFDDAAGPDSFDTTQRQTQGQQLGALSRRLLVLNQALLRLQSEQSDTTPLDQALTEQGSAVQASAGAAASEDTTLEALGDQPHLLGPQNVEFDIATGHTWDLGGNPFSTRVQQVVTPDVALPRTTDAATEEMLGEVLDTVRDLSRETRNLRDEVVPQDPTFLLDEFVRVYHHWFAFFSPRARDADSQYQELDRLYTGISSAFAMGGIEGGVARGFLMRALADHIQGALGGASADFSRELDRTYRYEGVSGDASDPRYNPQQHFPGDRNAAEYRRHKADTSLDLMRQIRHPTGGESRLEAAQRTGMVRSGEDAAFGIHLLRSQPARETWRYLLSTYVVNPNREGFVQEEKAMPPAVAQYLASAIALDRSVRGRHRPVATNPEGFTVPVGDTPTRLGGLENAAGTAEATYVEGEQEPSNSRVDRLRGNLNSIRGGTTTTHGRRHSERAEEITQRLVADLDAYLEEFYQVNEDPAVTLTTILLIAEKEHDISAAFAQSLTPEKIAEAVRDATLLLTGLGLLSRMGPIGRVLSQAAGEAMGQLGVAQDRATLATLVAWLTQAGQAGTFGEARLWAYFLRDIATELGQLLQGVASDAALGAARAIGARGSVPSTRDELLDTIDPYLNDEGLRNRVRDAADAEARHLQEQADLDQRSDPAVDDLHDFNQALVDRHQQSSVEPAPDRPLMVEPEATLTDDSVARIRAMMPEHMRTGVDEAAARQRADEAARADQPAQRTQDEAQRATREAQLEAARLQAEQDWPSYDQGSGQFTREQFIGRYEDGWRFNTETRRWNRPGSRTRQRSYFPEGITHQQALDILTSRSASFRPYRDVLLREGIATDAEILDALGRLRAHNRGNDIDFVRHGLKQEFQERLLARMVSPDPAAASRRHSQVDMSAPDASQRLAHQEMLRLTRDLSPADRGNLAESWYARVHAPDAAQHVTIPKERVLGQGVTLEADSGRVADLVQGDTLREMKTVVGPLHERDLAQYRDYLRLVERAGPPPGTEIDVGRRPRQTQTRVQRAVYTFPVPEGVRANAAWMRSELRTHGERLEFEIFSRSGERKVIGRDNLHELDEPGLSQWLGLPPP